MTAADGRRVFKSEAKPAVFRAELIGQNLKVNVYPKKDGAGFVWVLWGEMNLDDIDSSILDGGDADTGKLYDAVAMAVAMLMERTGRRHR